MRKSFVPETTIDVKSPPPPPPGLISKIEKCANIAMQDEAVERADLINAVVYFMTSIYDKGNWNIRLADIWCNYFLNKYDSKKQDEI